MGTGTVLETRTTFNVISILFVCHGSQLDDNA